MAAYNRRNLSEPREPRRHDREPDDMPVELRKTKMRHALARDFVNVLARHGNIWDNAIRAFWWMFVLPMLLVLMAWKGETWTSLMDVLMIGGLGTAYLMVDKWVTERSARKELTRALADRSDQLRDVSDRGRSSSTSRRRP